MSKRGGEPKHIKEILPQVLADFERVKDIRGKQQKRKQKKKVVREK